MAEFIYLKEDAVRMRQRLSMPALFICLKNLNSLPESFDTNRFSFKAKMGVFDTEVLLKVLVSNDSTGTRPMDDQEGLEIDQDNEVDINCKEFEEALERLNDTLKRENIEALKSIQKKHLKNSQAYEQRIEDDSCKMLSEDEIAVGIGVHLIKKLSGKALSTPRRCAVNCPCGCTDKLDEERNMCIGSAKTWHGPLDLLSHGVGVAVTNDPINTDEDDDRNPDELQSAGDAASDTFLERSLSNGKKTDLELKQAMSEKKLAGQLQVISQCIVSGWTEYNRHCDKSQFIPFVYINGSEFQCYIYNPVRDYLLMASHTTMFIEEDLVPLHPLDRYSGIFFLWLILHHWLFFRKQIPSLLMLDIDCGFHRQIELEHYKQLKEFRESVNSTIKGMNVTKRTCLNILPGKSHRKARKRKQLED